MTAIGVGDWVRIPWGLDTVRAIVREIYGSPGRRMALVAIQFTGGVDAATSDDAPTVTLPLESIELVEPASA